MISLLVAPSLRNESWHHGRMNAAFDITDIELHTKRLLLDEWNIHDLDGLFEYASNPHVGPRAGWNPHPGKEGSLRILNRFINDKKNYGRLFCSALPATDNNYDYGELQNQSLYYSMVTKFSYNLAIRGGEENEDHRFC